MASQEAGRRHVLAVIPTKDRFQSTLPLTMQAMAMQTRLPDILMIFNDGRQTFPFTDPLYKEMLAQLQYKGVTVQVMQGQGKGQHHGHQASLEMSKDLIWRVDDDEVPEPQTLARLLEQMTEGVGAVAPLVIIPRYASLPLPSVASGRMADCLFAPNLQWFFHDGGLREADHLYSSFLYRRQAGMAAGGYCLELSPIASREETLFSHGIKRAGYRLVIDTGALIWHLQNPAGGIRAYPQPKTVEALRHDELIFWGKMEAWGERLLKPFLVSLDDGEDSHHQFLRSLPALLRRLADAHLLVAARHPRLLEGSGVVVLPLSEKPLLSFYQEIDWEGRRLASPQTPTTANSSPDSFYLPGGQTAKPR